MTAQKHASRSLSSHGSNCRSKSLLVTFRTVTLRWPVRSQLAEREVAAEDGQPGAAERIRQGHQQGRFAVCPRAVRQDKAILSGIGRNVQKPSNRYFTLWSVRKFSIVPHPAPIVVNRCNSCATRSIARVQWRSRALNRRARSALE